MIERRFHSLASLAVVLLVGAFALMYSPVAAAATYDQAAASCSAYAAGHPETSSWTAYTCSVGTAGQCSAINGGPNDNSVSAVLAIATFKSNGSRACNYWTFTGGVPADLYCVAGQMLPSGTTVNYYPASGAQCTTATSSCETTLMLGGAYSGQTAMTGKVCPVTTGATQATVAPAAETVNADGSKTYCDLITGKCVTTSAGPAVAPASSSSSANSSTDTTSTTHNPASSSSSTTISTSTTTTTGDGSGTGGNSTGTTTGTSSTKTDTPASASSTASKCTGGACDVGLADGNMGQMYQAGTDTPGSVYGDFKAQVSSSPIMSAATGFFDASGLSGSTCPTWHIPGNKYWGAAGFSFDFFCSSGMLALLALAGYMVLAVGAFSAFRIAIY